MATAKRAARKKSYDAKKPIAMKGEKREVVYSEVYAEVCHELTAERAKELLGWEEETEKVKFGGDYMLVDAEGKKVRCHNNLRNRPFYPSLAKTWEAEVLKGRWRLNGDAMVIGKYGATISCQHRLAAIIMAAQEWHKDKERWPFWKTEPTMPIIINFGISEDDETVNTIDTGKPRSLSDVIDRSEFFADLHSHERHACSRMADHAIRFLWHRTGAGIDAFAPKRTHSDSLDFLARHPKILECVKHVYEENGKENKIGHYLSPGYAAGLLYLMGSSATEPGGYRAAKTPTEDLLDWGRWSAACDFFVELAGGAKALEAVPQAMAAILDQGGGSNAERWGILINAWLCCAAKEPIAAKDLELAYTARPDGTRELVDTPVAGGIDLGDPSDVDEAEVVADDPTEEEIKQRAAKVREKRATKEKKEKRPVLKHAHRADHNHWQVGDVAWVRDQGGEHYLGKITEDPVKRDDGALSVMVQADDGVWEVTTGDLSLKRPIDAPAPKPPTPRAEKAKAKAKKAPRAKGFPRIADLKVGDVRWVHDGDGEPWAGRVQDILGKTARLKIEQGHLGAGNVKDVPLSSLRAAQPAATGE